MRFFQFLVLIAFISLGSCTSTQKTVSTKTQGISETKIIQHPMMTDLDISPNKVKGSASSSELSLNPLKDLAVQNALSPLQGDVLVEPRFTVSQTGRITTVDVVGHSATYTNFRKVTAADSTVLNLAMHRSAQVYEPNADLPEKKSTTKTVLISFGIAIASIVAILAASGY